MKISGCQIDVRRAAQILFALAAVIWTGAACSRLHSKAADPVASKTLVWPAPPETPRIAYVQSLATPRDFGIRSSSFVRFGQWLTGTTRESGAMQKPFGLALDEKDNLCVTDTGANTVSYFDRVNRKWHHWTKVGAVRFVSPVAVARHNATFYVADSSLGKVIVFGDDGKLRLQVTNHLERPCAVVIVNNQLLVADSARHCVVVFDLLGNFQRQFGARGVEPGQLNFPTHLATDRQGLVYVTDSMNSRVQIFDVDGHFRGQIGQAGDAPGQFGRPKGVAVDAAGRVYALDAAFDALQIFGSDGKLLLTLGHNGSQPGEFWLPNGISITRSNEIFIADSYNRRVQVFKYVGPL